MFKEGLHGGSRDTFIEVRASVRKIHGRYCTKDTSEVLYRGYIRGILLRGYIKGIVPRIHGRYCTEEPGSNRRATVTAGASEASDCNTSWLIIFLINIIIVISKPTLYDCRYFIPS